jgi:hypothetical protein
MRRKRKGRIGGGNSTFVLIFKKVQQAHITLLRLIKIRTRNLSRFARKHPKNRLTGGFYRANRRRSKSSRMPDNRDFYVTDGTKIPGWQRPCNRLLGDYHLLFNICQAFFLFFSIRQNTGIMGPSRNSFWEGSLASGPSSRP